MTTPREWARVNIASADPNGLPCVTGCPVRAEDWQDDVSVCLRQADGAVIPAQAIPLTGRTPDGLRWIELSFKATCAGKAALLAGPVAPEQPRPASDAPEAVAANALVRARLSADPAAPPFVLDRFAGGRWTVLGSLDPVIETDAGVVHRDDPGARRTLRVLRSGPLRNQVEVCGKLRPLTGGPSLDYRLTVEVWEGIPAVRIDWMLSHLAPGCLSLPVKRAALEGVWEVGEQAVRRFVQKSYGTHYVPRKVTNPAPVALVTDFSCSVVHVENPAMLLDDHVYPRYLSPPTVGTADWLALEGRGMAVFATVRDFGASRPNRLASQGRTLGYECIPPGHDTDWPQGRRREQTLMLAVAPEGEAAAKVVPLLGRLWTPGRAVPDAGWLAELKCFEMDCVFRNSPGRNIRLAKFMRRLCDLDTPGDKWNIGDTPEVGYTRTYPGTPNHLFYKPGAPRMPVSFSASGAHIWPASMDRFLEPVWTNNEYDIIHGLALEVMRTGDTQPMTMLRWTARHQVEVDFVAFSDDPWHHRATPFHSHFHNTKGAISSHFFTQGLVQYYLLTGDRDALEVVEALGDKIAEIDRHAQARTWKFDREIGWGLLALVCLVEAGLERFRPEAAKIADYLQRFDRAAFKGAVNLSFGRPGRPLERQMVDNGLGYTPLLEAMDRYQRVSGSDELARWMDTLVRQLHQEVWNALDEGEVPTLHNMVTHMLAIGYERTGDPAFIRTGLVLLDAFFDSLGVGGNAADFYGGVKTHGKMYRALIRFLGHADKLGLLDPFEYPSLAAARHTRPTNG